MVSKKVFTKEGSTRTIQWKCVESRIDSKCLNYGRFILSPLKKGQADTIGIAMRRALLGEIKGTCITRAKFEKVKILHEYDRIVGIEETVYEILLNLKQIVLKSFTNQVIKGWINVKGPICITAKDISVPPIVQIVDTTQYIATLTIPIDLSIELQIERDRGYSLKQTKNFQDGSYPIDAVSMPVRTVNYTFHNRRNENEENEEEEILFIEIWTNGSLSPKEALCEASRNLIQIFTFFLQPEEKDINLINLLKEEKNTFTMAPLVFKDKKSELKFWKELEEKKKYIYKKIEELNELKKKKKSLNIPWHKFFIDQLGFSSRTYNCLKRGNINTLWDMMTTNEEDYLKIKYLHIEELLEITRFAMDMIDILVILYKDQPEKSDID